MKGRHHFLLLSLFMICMTFLLGYTYKLTGADIVSVNSGGTSNITVSPDTYTEGFFSNPTTPEIAANSSNVSGGGTGGVPGGGGGTIPTSNISINPGQFNLNMLVNTNLQEIVSVTNVGGNSITISISQTNLTNLVLIGNTTLTLAAGETKNLNLIFISPNSTGIYNGTINIGDRVLPISLNVVKQFILFDSNIVVLNKNYRVPQGNNLLTQVTMIPMGDKVRLDVTLNYIIKNINGTVYTTRSETLLVTSQQILGRTFQTGNLPIGNYTIGLELIYPYGVAPSSAHFEIVENKIGLFSEIIYWLLIAIVLVSISIIALRIIRAVKRLRSMH
jgi:hypothetical protein